MSISNSEDLYDCVAHRGVLIDIVHYVDVSSKFECFGLIGRLPTSIQAVQ